ncbi:hypothetical protein G4D82_10615 [Flavobacterium sp. CYK-4]|uniref:hypothetical protein n=1 Tax=Flavobacterium lotistagni TaxID=2709660 RepID=UPI001408458D|nr:hypothetical protein [Flavobacterium lotistagni]NHM07675.1 hypothetical protein [Flavobacterium lotistagni]
METKDYLQDIREIKNMMSQSTQFISLSGLSGVLAGIYALIGAYMAGRILPQPEYRYFEPHNTQETVNSLILIAMALMVLSIGTAYIMTVRKAKRIGESIWNKSAKRLLVNFAIPLATGGIFSLLLLLQTDYKLIAPVTLIFYGLACVNASKYTLRDVRYLGLTMVVLGLISVAFPGYGLYFWAIGFGFCHILYGAVMHFKYDSK